MSSEFHIYQDRSNEYRWRLNARNGETIADSGEGYVLRSGCKKAAERFKELTPDAPVEESGSVSSLPRFEVYKDRKGDYRWRFKAENADIMADSGEGYVSRYGAKKAARRVKKIAPKAPIRDRTRTSRF